MIFFIERNLDASTLPAFYTVTEWFYDTVDLHFGSHFFGTTRTVTIPGPGDFDSWPADGTVLASECDDAKNRSTYTYDTQVPPGPTIDPHFQQYYLVIDVIADSDDCCFDNGGDFTVTKTNNSSAISPDGKIVIKPLTGTETDMTETEATVDGVTWYPGENFLRLTIPGLVAGSYLVRFRVIGNICEVTYSVVITNTYDSGGGEPSIPSLDIQILQTPADFVPVFLPILYQFQFTGNTFTIRTDGNTYIDAGANADLKTFLSQLPYLRIIGSTNYNGNVRVTSVDNPSVPTKFYITSTYVSVEVVQFIPIDRQVFQLFGETSFNVFTKIADISVAADTNGIFTLRCEGFLQSMFEALQPASGDDISLGRKFYCIPKDYDLDLGSDETNPICTTVFGTQLLTPYLDDLIPLGPDPINFINTETGLGFPVIFSFLNEANQRVSNVISGASTDINTASSTYYLQALPGNTYTLTWISPTPIDPVFYPTLPDWITVIAQTDNSITIQIEAFTTTDGGDYDPLDYSENDYLINVLNAIVGCYTFQMFDGEPGSDDEPVFTLTTCIFPTQLLQNICGANLFNIAWVNLQGGWNSFIFAGRKEYGRSVGQVSSFKKVHELKKSSVEEVYDTVICSYSQRSLNELLFIKTLRTSIQAYLFNDQTQTWDIPIFIDKANFLSHQTPYRQGDQTNTFTFSYANEILVQRQ